MGRPFTSSNTASTLVDGVTARTIVAAGGSTEVPVVSSITVTNATTGENPIVTVYSTTGGIIDSFAMGDIGDAQVGTNASVTRTYSPPRRGYVGESILATASSATGDCYVTVSGEYQ